MQKDPTVDEVREAAKKIESQCNNDIDDYIKFLKEKEKKSSKKGWKIVKKKKSVQL